MMGVFDPYIKKGDKNMKKHRMDTYGLNLEKIEMIIEELEPNSDLRPEDIMKMAGVKPTPEMAEATLMLMLKYGI